MTETAGGSSRPTTTRVAGELRIGGVPLDPGVVETVLAEEPTVRDAVVTAVDLRPLQHLLDEMEPSAISALLREAAGHDDPTEALLDGLRRSGEELTLVAVVEATDDATPISVDRLQARVEERLPAPLRPTAFVVTEAIPRTGSGSPDRGSLLDRTITAAARAIAPTTPASQYRFVVPIQPGGSKPPIFGIHVLGPNAGLYRPLAAALGPDQPLFGLGLAMPDESPGMGEIPAIAERYTSELERIAPDGPVVLAAASLGGVVAYEMALQLRQLGREVALLALFDAAGPTASDYRLARTEWLRAHLRGMWHDPGRYVEQRREGARVRLSRLKEIAALRLFPRLGIPIPNESRIRAFIEANQQAQSNYRFEPYDGPMIVYKAGDELFTAYLGELGMGWKHLATGPFAVTTVPGGHLTMLAPPHVATLASVLRQDIDDALR